MRLNILYRPREKVAFSLKPIIYGALYYGIRRYLCPDSNLAFYHSTTEHLLFKSCRPAEAFKSVSVALFNSVAYGMLGRFNPTGGGGGGLPL